MKTIEIIFEALAKKHNLTYHKKSAQSSFEHILLNHKSYLRIISYDEYDDKWDMPPNNMDWPFKVKIDLNQPESLDIIEKSIKEAIKYWHEH